RTELKKVMGAVLETAAWLDEPANRAHAAATLSGARYVNASGNLIDRELHGVYDLGGGLGTKVFGGRQMQFCRGGEVNFPRLGHAIWFLSQYVRFGYLRAEPSYQAIARELILQDLYKEVA